MAFSTRSDGGRGFSLEASLMASVMPNSRSSSSMGLPGSYGAMPRMCSLARDSQDADIRDSLRRRVGPEDLEELAPPPHLGQHGPDVFGIAMTFEVHEVDVLPGTPLGRSRFDLGEVEAARGEWSEDAVEDAGLVLHGEEDRRLVPAGHRRRPPPDDEEAR